jgi:hypothetical protein
VVRTSGYVLAIFGAAVASAAYLFRFPFRIGLNGHYFEPWLLLKVVGIILSLLGILLIVRGCGQTSSSS